MVTCVSLQGTANHSLGGFGADKDYLGQSPQHETLNRKTTTTKNGGGGTKMESVLFT